MLKRKGGGGLAAYKTICILLSYVGDTNFILGNPIIIPLVFNREFNDWHLQWRIGFRLLGNGWLDLDDFFSRPTWNFYSYEMVKKLDRFFDFPFSARRPFGPARFARGLDKTNHWYKTSTLHNLHWPSNPESLIKINSALLKTVKSTLLNCIHI